MVPTQRQRSACIGLTVWLHLSMFWGRIKDPITYLAILRWLIIEPVPCLSEDRRQQRHILHRIWWYVTSERFKRTAVSIAMLAVVMLTLVSLYTAESVSCSTGGSCLFASAQWADWLFGK